MKIYFAGSIKAGRELAFQYSAIVELLKTYGTVLSEHVGSLELSPGGEQLDPSFIHSRDLSLLQEAELVIAEVTVPSLGVGYEIRYAIEQDKKVICLCHADKKDSLSAMITGSPKISKIFYADLDDLQNQLLHLSDHLSGPTATPQTVSTSLRG